MHAVKSIISVCLIFFFSMLSIAWGGQGEKEADITGKTLTLEDCLRIAVEQHPDIRSKIVEIYIVVEWQTEQTFVRHYNHFLLT